MKQLNLTISRLSQKRPLIYLIGASGIAAVANFVSQSIIARYLGPSQFGHFSYALASVNVMAPLACFGVAAWWLRVFGEEQDNARRWIKPTLTLAIFSTLSVLISLIIWTLIGPHDAATAALILILSCIIFSQTSIDLVAATFQINSDYTSLALWQLVIHLPRLIAIIILVSYVSHPTAKNVAFVYLLISIAVSASGIHYLRRFWGRETPFLRNTNAIKSLKHLGERQDMKLSDAFRKVAPFGLQSFGFLIFYQTDVIMLGWLSNKEEVGFYGLGVIFTAAAYLLPSVFYQKLLLPTIHRLAFEEQRTLIAFSRSGGYFSFAMGLIISIIIWNFGSYVVPLIVGEEYQPSISILYVMCLAIPFRYLADHFGSVMTTRDLIMNNLKVTGMAVLINVILNFLLIREFGAYGAAVATVISNIFLAGSYFIFARKNFLR